MSTAILLATKDGGRYIGELLDSLLAQTCKDFTVWLHDDGSEDDTLSIYERYRSDDPDRFRILEGPPQNGARENFFYLMRSVEADHYLFADDDDVWREDKVQKLMEALLKEEEARGKDHPVAAFCDMKVVDSKLNEIAPSFIGYMGRSPQYTRYTEVLIDNPAAGCSIAMNRALRDIAIGCDDISRVEMHDAWVMMTAAVFGSIVYVPEAMVLYRQHQGNELGAATESVIQKIGRNMGDFFSGRMYRNKRDFFRVSRDTAAEVCKLKGVPEDKRKVLEEYSRFDEHGRFYRISFCNKYGIRRAHHTLWMLMWI